MKILFFCILIACSLSANAQNANVNFTNSNGWKEIKEKAKITNKLIFVDVYATWCGPCKKMDQEVYNNTEVAKELNGNFISIKLQSDKTKLDNNETKSWYNDADSIVKSFKIESLPTFLFFSSQGTLIQRGEGFQDSLSFRKLIQTAINPDSSYAGLLSKYRGNMLIGPTLLKLALQAKKYHEDSLSLKIAEKYRVTWLEKSDLSNKINRSTLDFLSSFHPLITVKDKLFGYMYLYPEQTDNAMKAKGYSKILTDYVITKDIVFPIIRINGIYVKSPDWLSVERALKKRYTSQTALRIITAAKLKYYSDAQDWPNVVKFSIQKLEVNGIDTVGFGKTRINAMVYDIIVKHSDDPIAWNKGLKFMEIILKDSQDNDSWLDTYASLLYKAGRKKNALEYEKRALRIALEKKDTEMIVEYTEILRKIENNLPLW